MYDFDEIIDRRRPNSLKWSQTKPILTSEQRAVDPLPLWVADMDFRVAQPIIDAVREEVDFGVFGYGEVPHSCLEAIIDWQDRRFGWRPKPEWIVQTPGVVNAVNTCIQTFTNPGDFILVQPPVYFHIHNDITLNGRRALHAPLVLDGDRYRFDPEIFEAAIRPGTKLFILCNPHNPTGNVFSRVELLVMAEICAKHGILIISDEVHQDFILDRTKKHVPFAALDDVIADNSIVCTAPSKTFNIAGLQCANIFIPNERRRQDFQTQCAKNGANLMNTMGIVACEAAYRHCESWADAMLEYVRNSQKHFARRIQELGLPVRVIPGDALYLAWLDCRALGKSATDLHDFFIREAKVWLDPGTKFGPGGEGFMRVNVACPRNMLDEAINRIAGGIEAHRSIPA
ncbi:MULTISPECIES: MalY/PatB family protein [Hyphomicrobiales]|uniref:cysteine-S-conjugate beta-lyase n=2 Tax=Hyphomicrobiales TaxID=356 RepID=A0A6L3Y7J2_9HYPH|nr:MULTISPECIES: MalY/PatB family protein [Hyphomicrobiales]KAB2678453.1 pyridoxal phosphate-dependent aminotransferase [Brucella tritici]MBO0130475.1 pyridoxal phosphate-dependent aminotransferase [Agrobacterium burrii]